MTILATSPPRIRITVPSRLQRALEDFRPNLVFIFMLSAKKCKR